MPIAVACPECNSRITAPDSAAGKRVKCPKCQALMVLPDAEDDFEVVEDTRRPTPVVRKPVSVAIDDEDDERGPRRRRRDDDEDEDDYEDDRPRKKKRKKKATSRGFLGNPIVMLVGGLFGCLVAAGFVYKVWTATQREFEKANRDGGQSKVWGREIARVNPPAGWVRFSPPGLGVTVHTPVAMSLYKENIRDPEASTTIWQCVQNGRVYRLAVITPDRPTRLEPDGTEFGRFMSNVAQGGELGTQQNPEEITFSGCPGRQSEFRGATNAVVRVLLGQSRVYVFVVAGEGVASASAATVTAFFDTAEATR